LHTKKVVESTKSQNPLPPLEYDLKISESGGNNSENIFGHKISFKWSIQAFFLHSNKSKSPLCTNSSTAWFSKMNSSTTYMTYVLDQHVRLSWNMNKLTNYAMYSSCSLVNLSTSTMKLNHRPINYASQYTQGHYKSSSNRLGKYFKLKRNRLDRERNLLWFIW
jgi:hypothetical protein